VNFIIRAIDDILRRDFDIKQGLADHKRVTMLDFATGTGTFILEAFERMLESIGENPATRDLLVREHFLKNIYGFEYLIAPYTIAHLKLSQFLADRGHKLHGTERLQVYLTNTLEPIAPQINYLLPALSEEAEKAQEIKKKPILVITGNPPYSAESRNNGAWISDQIDSYKKADGKPLGERNPRWLNDDYVKFIRFAQDKIDQVDEGVVGIISNHSFLDNPTFRGMRQSLMASFDKIYVLDLHGSNRRREETPGGLKDENVFDIEQGVAISLFIKTKDPASRSVRRADFWGSRLEKYQSCFHQTVDAMVWRELKPQTPFYLFQVSDNDLEKVYRQYYSIPEIFLINGTGIITKRDNLCIKFTVEEVLTTVQKFLAARLPEIHQEFGLPDDVRDWRAEWAQNDLKKHGIQEALVKPISYRPFDNRFIYYTGQSRGFVGWPVEKVMRHMLHENVALLTARSNKSQDMNHFFVSKNISETKCAEATTQSCSFPLYIYPVEVDEKPKKSDLFGVTDSSVETPRLENISPQFRQDLKRKYGLPALSPEQIFGYIYGVLYAPSYRLRFGEFLRGDFPRIPLCPRREEFLELSALGWALAQSHLMKQIPPGGARYRGKGENEVGKPRFAPLEQAVYINATQYFAPVPEEVWALQIGGYQVLEKYLKARRGRKLNLEEVQNVQNISAILALTIAQMKTIDRVYIACFPLDRLYQTSSA
jgi:predicted helicase